MQVEEPLLPAIVPPANWKDKAMTFSHRSILGAAISACLLAPLSASAATLENADFSLSLAPKVTQPSDDKSQAGKGEAPNYLAVAPETPNIHGFFNSPFGTAYITPRGLVVENQGLVWQPVVGLEIPIPEIGLKNFSIDAGIWNSVNSHNNDPKVGAWNEMDVWVGFAFDITPELHVHSDYEAWNFPGSSLNKPQTEHVSETTLTYNDSKMWGDSGFALHPQVKFFWSISGSSTVVLGRGGNTYYFEPGIVPSFTIKGSTPITISVPIYTSIGPKEFWGSGVDALHKGDGNFGLVSAGVKVGVPLTFIPVKYGHWHADAGVQYYYLINDALLRAGNLLSGNTDRSIFRGYVGVGVGF
jgi:hypothetical protein